jgi:phenylpropionate dioxygenase-like ring-hydroxylating dioxygenase large terminal subunit
MDLHAHWWPLATEAELKHDKPLARTLHDQPLVLFRGSDGQPVVMPDRCPHRHAPLSCGRVHHGELACPYHGWQFTAAGQLQRPRTNLGLPAARPRNTAPGRPGHQHRRGQLFHERHRAL